MWRSVVLAAGLISGCTSVGDIGGVVAQPPEVAANELAMLDPECVVEQYDFAGTATLGELGLQSAVPAPLPDLNQPAEVWVTHGGDGRGRMLCFLFEDGSGGSQWPVSDDWRLPGSAPSDAADPAPFPIELLTLVIGAGVIVALSIAAFVPIGPRGRSSG